MRLLISIINNVLTFHNLFLYLTDNFAAITVPFFVSPPRMGRYIMFFGACTKEAPIDEEGICRVNFCENTLKGMGTYSGGQLEEDWKSRTRKLCDVTYRAMVILYHAGKIQ